MKCFRCDLGPHSGATLFRVNAKGVPGVWACHAHRLEPDKELDGIVARVELSQDKVLQVLRPVGGAPRRQRRYITIHVLGDDRCIVQAGSRVLADGISLVEARKIAESKRAALLAAGAVYEIKEHHG